MDCSYAVEAYKKGASQAELTKVYEKILPGVWSLKGYFDLIDYNIVHDGKRKVFRIAGGTVDACRHCGMTELEEAALTDGQGRALSAHKSQQAYEGYAKRTLERALSATRKRHAHRLRTLWEHLFRMNSRMPFRMTQP
jgi:hypothetical protein